jgi:hypothetical protein
MALAISLAAAAFAGGSAVDSARMSSMENNNCSIEMPMHPLHWCHGVD